MFNHSRTTRRSFLTLALPVAAAVVCAGNALPARAALIDITIAPPAPREEHAEVRKGFVWTPGYYRWDGHGHVWVPGTYVKERPGHRWVAARWSSAGGHYHFEEGHWD